MNAPIHLKNLLPTSNVQQGADVVHESAHLHVTGKATYTDDIPEMAGTLYAAIITGLPQSLKARLGRVGPASVEATDNADIP